MRIMDPLAFSSTQEVWLLPPELLKEGPSVRIYSDDSLVWSAGIVIFYLLVGEHPLRVVFKEETLETIKRSIVKHPDMLRKRLNSASLPKKIKALARASLGERKSRLKL